MNITYSTVAHPNAQWVYTPQWIPQCFLARVEGRIVTVIGMKNSFSITQPMEWRVIDSEEYREGSFQIERIGP